MKRSGKSSGSSAKSEAIILGAIVYLAVIYVFLHIGVVEAAGQPVMDVFEHMSSHPFAIFPVSWKWLSRGLLVGFIPLLLIYADYTNKRNLRPGRESGSAKWFDDMTSYNKQFVSQPLYGSESKNMILAQDLFLSLDGYKTQRNCNICIIGGAGSGKSRGFAIPNLLQANSSFVVTDPSGELYAKCGDFLRGQGYTVRVINLVDMENSDQYNPFAYVRDEQGVHNMVTSIIKNTTPPDTHGGEAFWENAMVALVEAICHMVRTFDVDKQNFRTVMSLLRMANKDDEKKPSELENAFTRFARQHGDEHIAVKSFASFKAAGGKTASSILTTCLTQLHAFTYSGILHITDADTLNLNSMGDEKIALFCITPTADTSFNFLVSMLYTQLFDTLYYKAETDPKYKNERLTVPVRFILDEFANIGTIPDFANRLATMRKHDISCAVILQALPQLKTMYKDEWESILGNCDTFIYLGSPDYTTQEYVSKQLGKETIRTINTSKSSGKGGSSVSYNTTARDLMAVEELRVMPKKDCVVLITGLDPFYCQKFKLEQHPNYKQLK